MFQCPCCKQIVTDINHSNYCIFSPKNSTCVTCIYKNYEAYEKDGVYIEINECKKVKVALDLENQVIMNCPKYQNKQNILFPQFDKKI